MRLKAISSSLRKVAAGDCDGCDATSGVRPKTVDDLSKVKNGDDAEPTTTYATVVSGDPTCMPNCGDASTSTTSATSAGSASAESDGEAGPASPQGPMQPTDPSAPGQRSVADQAFDILQKDPQFQAAQKAEKAAQTARPSAPPAAAAPVHKCKCKHDDQVECECEQFGEDKGKKPGIPVSPNNYPPQFGPHEEIVARYELDARQVDDEVQTKRYKFAAQRKLTREQKKQLEDARSAQVMQSAATAKSKEAYEKASDEEAASETRLETARKAAEAAPDEAQKKVLRAVYKRLKDAHDARVRVTKGRKEDAEADAQADGAHQKLVQQIVDSIKKSQKEEVRLRKERDGAVKKQQKAEEQVADARAEYGLSHAVDDMIGASDPQKPEPERVRYGGDTATVTEKLAVEGTTMGDAAKWRTDQVRTGQAEPISPPQPATGEELSAAVGASIGASRGAQVGSTHGMSAAADALSNAGKSELVSFVETGSGKRHGRRKKARKHHKTARKAHRGKAEPAPAENLLETSAGAQSTTGMLVESKKALGKLAETLSRAEALREKSNSLWKKTSAGKLAPEKSPAMPASTAAARGGSARAAANLFSGLPEVDGDPLFEKTREWLTGSTSSAPQRIPDSSSSARAPVPGLARFRETRASVGVPPSMRPALLPRFRAMSTSMEPMIDSNQGLANAGPGMMGMGPGYMNQYASTSDAGLDWETPGMGSMGLQAGMPNLDLAGGIPDLFAPSR